MIFFNLQIVSCFLLTGLIWIIQVVHYPSFIFVAKEHFSTFHEFHSRKITWIVAPLMALELISAAALCFYGNLWILNFAAVLALWGLTGFVSVPLHNRLAKGWDSTQISSLVKTNWFRTGIWTVRSVIFALLLQNP